MEKLMSWMFGILTAYLVLVLLTLLSTAVYLVVQIAISATN